MRTFFRLASLFTPKRWLGGLFIKFFVSLFVISGSSTVAIIGFGTWKSQVELKEALSEDKLHDRVAVEGRVVAELLQAAATPEEALWQLIKGTGLEGYPTAEGLEANTREQDAVGVKAKVVRNLINANNGSITKAKQKH